MLASKLWGDLSLVSHRMLRALTCDYGFSIAVGDLQLIEGRWYITHAGLLRLAARRKCNGIRTSLQTPYTDSNAKRWVFRAVVYKTGRSKGFVGYGDADPSNVSPLVRGAEMRIAETRAVNRALRKAYGIGLCSVEELGWSPKVERACFAEPRAAHGEQWQWPSLHPPRLRDQLCLLIRQHELDPNLVKAYAAHFCGTETIKDASRDLVESFISHLAASAKEDRDGLICKLNSFASVEVHNEAHIFRVCNSTQPDEAPLEGLFLVRVEWASYRWHRQKPFLSVRFVVLSRLPSRTAPFPAASIAPNALSGN